MRFGMLWTIGEKPPGKKPSAATTGCFKLLLPRLGRLMLCLIEKA
jgi:hypothetical protein